MSINKLNIPDDLDLSKILKIQGSNNFYFNFVKGREVCIGPLKSIQFIKDFIKKYENTKSEFYKI